MGLFLRAVALTSSSVLELAELDAQTWQSNRLQHIQNQKDSDSVPETNLKVGCGEEREVLQTDSKLDPDHPKDQSEDDRKSDGCGKPHNQPDYTFDNNPEHGIPLSRQNILFFYYDNTLCDVCQFTAASLGIITSY